MTNSQKEWSSTRELIASLPADGSALPIYCMYPAALRLQAKLILASLPCPYYAVKANTMPLVLDCVAAEGFRHFDVASMLELRAVLEAAPDAVCAYMNPVKQDGDIRAAYRLGVRLFALDSIDELQKILRVTEGAAECTLIVRLSLAPKRSVYDMTGKFGASPADAIALLQQTAALGLGAGLTFHVGSQCENPESYVEAIEEAAEVARAAGIALSVLDVGGGFPARYRNNEPELARFGQLVAASFARHQAAFGERCTLQTEPGRSMVAGAGSVLVRVALRRAHTLFLNEGLHGLLSELRWMPGFHPVRRVGHEKCTPSTELIEFSLAGPTCDSGDFMKGPYLLPADIGIGDWIEIGFLGAYCIELVTPFNGFGRYDTAVIRDATHWYTTLQSAEFDESGRQP